MQALASRTRVLQFCTFHLTCWTISFTLISESRMSPSCIFVQTSKAFSSTRFSLPLSPETQIFSFSLSLTLISKNVSLMHLHSQTPSIPNPPPYPFHTLFLFSSAVRSPLIPLYAAQPTLQAPPQRSIWRNNPLHRFPFIAPLSLLFYAALSIPLSSLLLPASISSLLFTIFYSSRTQRRSTLPPSSCRRSTHIRPGFDLICKLAEQFSSILVIPFTHIQTLEPKVQTHSTLTTKISQFILHH